MGVTCSIFKTEPLVINRLISDFGCYSRKNAKCSGSKCKDLLLFFVFYDSKLNIFGIYTAEQNKHYLVFREMMGIGH